MSIEIELVPVGMILAVMWKLTGFEPIVFNTKTDFSFNGCSHAVTEPNWLHAWTLNVLFLNELGRRWIAAALLESLSELEKHTSISTLIICAAILCLQKEIETSRVPPDFYSIKEARLLNWLRRCCGSLLLSTRNPLHAEPPFHCRETLVREWCPDDI